MSLQVYAGAKKLKVNLGGAFYIVNNSTLEEAFKYAELIKNGSKTFEAVPEHLRSLVDSLIK